SARPALSLPAKARAHMPRTAVLDADQNQRVRRNVNSRCNEQDGGTVPLQTVEPILEESNHGGKEGYSGQWQRARTRKRPVFSAPVRGDGALVRELLPAWVAERDAGRLAHVRTREPTVCAPHPRGRYRRSRG